MINFEKILEEKLSKATFDLIKDDEKAFSKLLENMESICREYFQLVSEEVSASKMRKKLMKIARFYGKDNQLRNLQEECAELIIEVNKMIRGCERGREGLVEELADAQIMIMQAIYLLEIDEEVVREMDKKINRQIIRIRTENS